MENKIQKIISEYVVDVTGLNFPIKGRVLEIKDEDSETQYRWEVSHYCKPSDRAGVYAPSLRIAATIKEEEALLHLYLFPFTDIGVEKNNFY